MTKKTKYPCIILIHSLLLTIFILASCDNDNPKENPIPEYPEVNRLDKLPADIVKRGPETDQHPPILHSNAYEEPVPFSFRQDRRSWII
jgi:hypothetical protein